MVCASIDLKSFFDEIPHCNILKFILRKIVDEKLVTLVARGLNTSLIVEGRIEKTRKGCPQGSPVSPMLSNIVLNELEELREEAIDIVDGRDYCLTLLKSEWTAKRVMDRIEKYLEEELILPVNKEKSGVSEVKHVTFLGIQILWGKIRVSDKSRTKFNDKIRDLTRRNNTLSMCQIIKGHNEYLQGWVVYFGIQQFKKLFGDLDGLIRRWLQSMQLKKWKNPRKFQQTIMNSAFKPQKAYSVWIRMNKW